MMKDLFAEEVYQTLTGQRTICPGVPGVENAFAQGAFCMERYGDMLKAYERLRDRLGVEDEDDDVEVIINALMDIERELSMKMYEYGGKFRVIP